MWRRIDVVGMESCAVHPSEAGFHISGSAMFVEENTPARLDYTVYCKRNWECSGATVDQWLGADRIRIELLRQEDSRWAVNGQTIDGVDALLDIDLGFTPATNTNAIKRLQLSVGEYSEFTAVWLDDQTWSFKPLKQRYERLNENTYKYVSVESGYEAELLVDEFGFVRLYPELWETVLA